MARDLQAFVFAQSGGLYDAFSAASAVGVDRRLIQRVLEGVQSLPANAIARIAGLIGASISELTYQAGSVLGAKSYLGNNDEAAFTPFDAKILTPIDRSSIRAVGGAGGIQGRTIPFIFGPTGISGLVQWLRSDVGTVSSWTDQSGNGNHATQPTGGAQPTIVTNVLNGRPAYRWAAGQSMINPLALSLVSTVLIVMNYTGSSTFGCAYSASGAFPAIYGTLDASHHWGVYTSTAAHSAGTTIATAKSCIVVSRSNSDCDLITSGSVLNVNPGAPLGTFGAHIGFDLGDQFVGDIYEIAAWNRSLTTVEISQLTNYIANTYGI